MTDLYEMKMYKFDHFLIIKFNLRFFCYFSNRYYTASNKIGKCLHFGEYKRKSGEEIVICLKVYSGNSVREAVKQHKSSIKIYSNLVRVFLTFRNY
jgi:hypothetical protein